MSDNTLQKKGVMYAIVAYMCWGLLPIYWKAVQAVPPIQILAHRILWSFVFVTILLLIRKQIFKARAVLKDKTTVMGLILSSLIISLNWFIYIWAVNNNKVVEASLGYYINPLFTVLIGVIFLHERLDKWQVVSLILAGIGVLILTLEYGQIPWISLGLAITFGLYSLAKRLVQVDSITGLALETAVMVPVALIYLSFIQASGEGIRGDMGIGFILLIMGTGIATAFPLLTFAQAAKTVSFSTIGFIQYFSPTISLLLGIFLFQEEFTRTHVLSFSAIWLAILVFSISRVVVSKRENNKKIKAAAK